jgi:protein-S-isoprenylcysteine O-methyltransferase Ste14
LLCAIAASWGYGSWHKWLLSLLLAAVLVVKLRREEKKLLEHFEGYAAYRARTGAIIPFLL